MKTVYVLINKCDKAEDCIINVYKKVEDAQAEWDNVYAGNVSFMIIELPVL